MILDEWVSAAAVAVWNAVLYQALNHPFHLAIESLFVLFVLFLLPQKRYNPEEVDRLTDKEVEDLIDEWEPKPLLPERSEKPRTMRVVSSACRERIKVDGIDAINFASYNFLGYLCDDEIQNTCESAIRKYGVGACGPRGFYGTIDVHLEQEKCIADFFGTEEAIVYSFDFATVSSVIPAFLKRGDLILCDEACHQAIKSGCELSRSNTLFFPHNDVVRLESMIKEQIAKHEKSRKGLNRRFIVVEGLYLNYGDIAPLREIIALKNKYKFRLLVDDSAGVGVLGKTGRGTLELLGIPFSDVEIFTGSLGFAFCAQGGFCAGSHVVVDHQRLSGSGYCFSAALPPYLSVAGTECMKKLDSDPSILKQLQNNVAVLRESITDIPFLSISSVEVSPLIHLRCSKRVRTRDVEQEILERVVDRALELGVALTTAKYSPIEQNHAPPSIRLCVSARHTPNDLSEAASVIRRAWQEIVSPYFSS